MDGWTTFPAKQEYHFHLPLPKKVMLGFTC